MENHETSGVQPQSKSSYLLDNAAPQTTERFDALSALYDRESIQCLEGRGVRPGWNCLEVGGGPEARSRHGSPLASASRDM